MAGEFAISGSVVAHLPDGSTVEIHPDELDFTCISIEEAGMGPRSLYRAKRELGPEQSVTWELEEYPAGFLSDHTRVETEGGITVSGAFVFGLHPDPD